MQVNALGKDDDALTSSFYLQIYFTDLVSRNFGQLI